MAENSNQDGRAPDQPLSNKIAMAILAALTLVVALPQIAGAVFGGGHHGGGHGDELHLAYCCVELETQAGAAEAPPVLDLGTLLANANVTAGERRAALCTSCHTFVRGGANGTGPNLWNIVGRPVASSDGFNYSGALSGFGGEWTYERLDGYLKNSQEYLPGTSMVQRFPRDNQRADILAFLGSLSESPVAFPEPAPAANDNAEAPAEDDHGGDH